MSRSIILVLGLLNIALLGLVAFILVLPPVSDDFSMTGSPGTVPEAGAAIPAVTDVEDDGIGGSMFGSGAMVTRRPAEMLLGKIPSTPGAALTLIGVLLADDGPAGHLASVLIRHGTPPQTSRLPLGGTVDGWRVVAATRMSAKLVEANGQELTLEVGKAASLPRAGR